VATTPDQRRREREVRARRVRRQRRGLVALLAAILAVAVVALASGGGGEAGRGHSAGTHTAKKPRTRPSPVDETLRHTDYVLKGTRRRREVALTFDDGPSPYTLRILRVLRKRRAAATFFPIGQSINQYPNILRRVRRRGFPIGDHTMSHPLMGHLTRDRQSAEIDGQARVMRRVGVPYPRLFRPPDGSFDDVTRDLLHGRRMLMVLWSVNPEDYFRPGTKAIVQRVMAGVRPGAIVLMHDGGGDRSQTVAALPAIIHRLRARHYRVVTVPRLLSDDPPPRGQGPPPNLAGV
jgi:peptidoglycan/xylan/chitin deacetylase (PgdA/CDA1 family)